MSKSNVAQLKIEIDRQIKNRFDSICKLSGLTMKQVIGDFILTYLSENKEVA